MLQVILLRNRASKRETAVGCWRTHTLSNWESDAVEVYQLAEKRWKQRLENKDYRVLFSAGLSVFR